MPARIKAVLSIIVAVAAILGFFFQSGIGQFGPSYAALAFGAIAIISMWIFPEVANKKKDEHGEKPQAPETPIKFQP